MPDDGHSENSSNGRKHKLHWYVCIDLLVFAGDGFLKEISR